MRIFFLIVCFLIFHNTHAQHRLGVGVNAGIHYQFVQKNDPFGAVATKGAGVPLAGLEMEWEFVPTYSLQIIASLSQFVSMLSFKKDGTSKQTGGDMVNSQLLGFNLKKRLWSFSTRILPKVDEIVLSVSSGLTYVKFEQTSGGWATNTGNGILSDANIDHLGVLDTHFLGGSLPLYSEYYDLHQKSNLYGRIGLEISFVIRRFSLNYHFFGTLGMNEFFKSDVEYKYYQEPIQKASLKYNGTGIGGTFGIRYHFKL